MATLFLCSVYDEKAEAFHPPMAVAAPGLAVRDFTDAFSGEAKMAKYRADFSLYEIGTFDSSSAALVAHVTPRLIMRGGDLGGAV